MSCSLFYTRQQGWSLLSIFVTTILGLVLAPLPVGAWAFIAVSVTLVTNTLTFAQVGGWGSMQCMCGGRWGGAGR